MTAPPTHLIDNESRCIATLDVHLINDHYEGSIGFEATPAKLLGLFKSFEGMVTDQVFNRADELEEAIESLGLRVLLADGTETPVHDLQVFPSTQAISFSLPVAAFSPPRQ